MKRFILFVTINLIAVGAMAQLTRSTALKRETVGVAKSGGVFVADLGFVVDNGDTTYSIIFRNQKYQSIADVQNISFASEGGTADQLYQLLTDILTDDKKESEYQENITLGETQVLLTKRKVMGVYYVNFFCSKGYFSLTKKMVDKLFNH